ncbi:MAG: NCS2 family permease [Clostridium sp.]
MKGNTSTVSSNGFLERTFKLKKNGTNVKTEVLAGITTFLTCVYIVAVNPTILGTTGMDPKAVFWATALAAAIGCILMGVLANFPFALAPAMGLNAYFAFYVVGVLGLTWQNALGCVLISGICFIILSLLKVQQKIVDEMPHCIKHSVGAGIGFFIAFTGLSQAGIIVSSEDTLIKMGDLSNPGALLALLGIIVTAVLVIKRVRGGILVGILLVTILGLFVTNPVTGGTYTIWPEGGLLAFDNPATALAPTFGQLSFDGMFNASGVALLGIIFAIFSFLFVDLFDGIGVLLGVSAKAGFLNEKGELPGAGKALFANAVAATAGAVLGTNTVAIYGAESTTGIAEGGRTGLTAVVTGILFVVALFLSPLFLMIPAIATAPALVMVGVFMMEPLMNLKLDDISIAFPVFLAVVIMPFTYSIAHGILFSIIGYTVAQVAAGKSKEISRTVWVLTVIFTLYLAGEILLS